MVVFKRAARAGTEVPTFAPEKGYKKLPEWDSWVADKGRRTVLKREVVLRGGQVSYHKSSFKLLLLS